MTPRRRTPGRGVRSDTSQATSAEDPGSPPSTRRGGLARWRAFGARALLIANPRAGRKHPGADAVADILAGRYSLETIACESPQVARKAAHDAAERGFEAVFSLGGDGTARQVAAGLLGSDTALGVLPGGTANVVAHSLGLGGRAVPAARRLVEAGTLEADVGVAGDQIFLMQASGGLDAEAVESVDPKIKRRLGVVAYATAAARCWWQYDYPEIEIEVAAERVRVAFFAVCNIPYYAGPLHLAPDTGFQSRQLELVTLARTGKWAALEFAAALVTRHHTDLDGVEAREVDGVVIHGPPSLAMQVDGDPLRAEYPVPVRLAEQRLRLLVPGE